MAEITKKKRTLVDDLKDFRTGKIGDKYYNNIKNANEYYYKDSGINYKSSEDLSKPLTIDTTQNTLGNTAKTTSSNNKKDEEKKKPVIKNANDFAKFGQNAFENPKQGIKSEKGEKKQQYILDLDNSGGLPSSKEISAVGNAVLSPIGKITTEADKYREYENEYKDYSYDQFKSEAEKVDDKADNGWKKKWFDSAIVEKRNEFYSNKYKDYDYKKLKTESSNNKLSDEEREWLKNTADEKATSDELQGEYDSLTKEYNTLYNSRDEESSYNRLKEIEDRQENLKSLIEKKKYEEKKKVEYDDVIENDQNAKDILQKYYYLEKYEKLKETLGATGYSRKDIKVKSSQDAYDYIDKLLYEEKEQIRKEFNSLENKDTLYKYYKREREEQETAEQNQILTNYSEEHPILGSLASMGLNTYGSIEDTVKYAGAGIDKAFGGDGYINPDSTNVAKAQLIREKVSEDMDGLGKFFYNTGMSIGDNLARLPLLALPGGEAMSLALAGTSAGVSSANDVINSGGNLESALWTGAAAGTAEVVFEKIPLDKLIKLKNEGTEAVWKAVAEQMAVEGMEEGLTDITNAITDQIINGDMSQLALQYQNYIAQGYSEEEARKQIAFDFASQLGQSFAAGAISGGVMSGGIVALNAIGNKVGNKASKPKTVSQLGREAMSSDDFNVNALIEEGKKSGNPKAENLAKSLEKVVKEKGADKVSHVDVGNLMVLCAEDKPTDNFTIENVDKQDIIGRNFELNGEKKTSKMSNDSEVKYTDTKAFGESYPHGIAVKTRSGGRLNIVGVLSSAKDFGVEDNNVILLADNGNLINADDVIASVPHFNQLLDYAKNFDTIGARVFLSQYEDYTKRSKSNGKKADIAEYSECFERLYSYGIKGVTYDSIKKSGNFTREINILGAGVAYSAVQSGNNDFKVDTRDKSNKRQKIRMPGESNSISSKVYVDPGSEDSVKVTDEQLAILQAAAEKYGREIVLTDRMGERTGDENANGGYNPNDGKIYINAEVHDSYMLSVSLHEAVHGVAADNPAEYHALCTFITNYLVAKGENIDNLLDDIKIKWGDSVRSEEAALEELVCQTVMAIATDEAAIKTALSLEENMGILKKVASALKKIAKAAYDFIKGVGIQAHNKQAQPWIDNIEALNELAVRLEKAFESTRKLNEQRANATKSTETAQKNNTQSDVKFSYGGPTAKTANISRLDQAIQMENSGKDTEVIRQKTGWFRGMDGKWRFEIDDSKMRFYKATKQDIKNTEEYKNNKIRYNGLSHKIANNTATAEQQQKFKAAEKYIKEYETSKKLSDYVSHPELFKAYPQLKEVNFYFDTISAKGAYYPDSNAIVINPTLSQAEQRESVIHEIQHAIQHIEGFADGSTMAQWQKSGADSLTAYNNYINTAGEIEARDAANRINLNSEQRKNTSPDIDRKDVVFAEGGASYYVGYTTDNKPVAIINDDILAGVPKSQWVKTVKNTITSKFSGGIPIKGKFIKVNRISKREYTNSKYSQHLKQFNKVIYKDKFKTANNLDEIIIASTNYVNEDLKHTRKDKFIEFARGDVLIRVGNNDYSAKVIIGFTTANNMVLYDIVDFVPTSLKIKKVGTHTAQQQNKNAKSSRTSVSTNNNLSQNNNNVKHSVDDSIDIEELLFDEEFYKPFENEDKTVITESLSELQTKLENMNDDNSTWEEQFEIRTKIKALKEGYKSPYDYFVGKQKKNILKEYEYNPEKFKEKFKEKAEKKAKEESLKNDIANTTPHKRAQYYIIQKTNPMWDDYHLGIRSPKDIKTFQEVIDEGEGFEWGDFDLDDAKKALKKGTVRVYSSYAIKNGTFVSTSYQQALEYAGMNPQNVHSRVVALDSVAWINGDEGQYAKVYKSDLDSNISEIKLAVDDTINDGMFADGDLFDDDGYIQQTVFERAVKDNPDFALTAVYNHAAKTAETAIKQSSDVKLDDKAYLLAAHRLMARYDISRKLNKGFDEELAETIRKHTERMEKGVADFAGELELLVDECKDYLMLSGWLDEEAMKLEREDILGYLRGKTLVIPEYAESDVKWEYDTIRRYRNKMFGKVNVALERNNPQGNIIYINDVIAFVEERYMSLITDEADEISGFKWLDNLVNNVLQPRFVNHYADGYGENIDTAAIEMAFDVTTEIINAKAKYAVADSKTERKYIRKIAIAKEQAAAEQRALLKAKVESYSNKAKEERSKRIKMIDKLESLLDEKTIILNMGYETIRDQYNENRTKTVYREKLGRMLDRMTKKLDGKANNNEYIPEVLKKPILDVLSSFTADPGTYKNGKKKALPGYYGEWKNIAKIGDRVNELTIAYESLKSKDNSKEKKYSFIDVNSIAFREGTLEVLKYLSENLSGKNIYDLSADDLIDIYEAMQELDNSLRSAVEIILDGQKMSVQEAANRAIAETESVKYKKDVQRFSNTTVNVAAGTFRTLKNKFLATQLDPKRFGRVLTGYHDDYVISQVMSELHEGDKKRTRIMQECFVRVQAVTSSYSKSEIKGLQRNDVTEFNFKEQKTGKRVKVSQGMLLAIYLTDRQADGHRHLVNENFNHYTVIPDLDMMNLGRDGMNKSHRVRFSEADLRAIKQYVENNKMLSELAGAISEVYNTVLNQYINEVSMAKYGKLIATVKNYYPLWVYSDGARYEKNFEAEFNDIRMKNRSFTKQRTRSYDPIVINDVLKTFTKSVQSASEYCGLLISIENFKRVYNSGNGDVTLHEAIKEKFGESAEHYIEKLMADLQNAPEILDNTWFQKAQGNYMGAKLLANPGAAIKQLAAFPTAFNYFGVKNVTAAAAVGMAKIDFDLYAKYTPYLWYRKNGNGTVIGELSREMGFYKKSMDRIDIMGKMDRYVVGCLLYAAELHVEQTTDLKRGTDAFYKEVVRQFEKCVDETQPNNMITSKPQFIRNNIMKLLSLNAFKSQNMAIANSVIDSFGEFAARRAEYKESKTEEAKAAKKEAAKKFVGSAIGAVCSSALIGILTVAVNLFLWHKWDDFKDEEGNVTPLTILLNFIDYSLESFVGCFAWADKAYDAISAKIKGEKYWGLEVMSIKNLNDSVEKLTKGDFVGFATIIVDCLGFPLENLLRIARSISSYANDIWNGNGEIITENNSLRWENNTSYFNFIIVEAKQKGETEKAEHFEQMWKDDLINKQGKTEKQANDTIKTKLVTALAASDDDVEQAALAKANGDLSSYEEHMNKVVGYGFDSVDVKKAVDKVIKNVAEDVKNRGLEEKSDIIDDLKNQGFNDKGAEYVYKSVQIGESTESDEVMSAFSETSEGEGVAYTYSDAFEYLKNGDKENYERVEQYLIDNNDKTKKDVQSAMRSASRTDELWKVYFEAQGTLSGGGDPVKLEELKKILTNIYGSWSTAVTYGRKYQNRMQEKEREKNK